MTDTKLLTAVVLTPAMAESILLDKCNDGISDFERDALRSLASGLTECRLVAGLFESHSDSNRGVIRITSGDAGCVKELRFLIADAGHVTPATLALLDWLELGGAAPAEPHGPLTSCAAPNCPLCAAANPQMTTTE
jgi:hypothetical protein